MESTDANGPVCSIKLEKKHVDTHINGTVTSTVSSYNRTAPITINHREKTITIQYDGEETPPKRQRCEETTTTTVKNETAKPETKGMKVTFSDKQDIKLPLRPPSSFVLPPPTVCHPPQDDSREERSITPLNSVKPPSLQNERSATIRKKNESQPARSPLNTLPSQQEERSTSIHKKNDPQPAQTPLNSVKLSSPQEARTPIRDPQPAHTPLNSVSPQEEVQHVHQTPPRHHRVHLQEQLPQVTKIQVQLQEQRPQVSTVQPEPQEHIKQQLETISDAELSDHEGEADKIDPRDDPRDSTSENESEREGSGDESGKEGSESSSDEDENK